MRFPCSQCLVCHLCEQSMLQRSQCLVCHLCEQGMLQPPSTYFAFARPTLSPSCSCDHCAGIQQLWMDGWTDWIGSNFVAHILFCILICHAVQAGVCVVVIIASFVFKTTTWLVVGHDRWVDDRGDKTDSPFCFSFFFSCCAWELACCHSQFWLDHCRHHITSHMPPSLSWVSAFVILILHCHCWVFCATAYVSIFLSEHMLTKK